MKNKKILASLATVSVLGAQASSALAAETLLYSNEVMEINANTTILDFDETGGDINLQFGNNLAQNTLKWSTDGGRDGLDSAFTFTDDVMMEGNLNVGGTFRVDSGTGNGYFELVNYNATGDYSLIINNDGLDADLLVTGADLKKLSQVAASASGIDSAVTNSHVQNTDTGTSNATFEVNNGGVGGSITIEADQSNPGNYVLTINNAGLTSDLTITGADLEKLANLTVTASEINAAVAASHDQNTDTGTTSDAFNVNSDGADASLTFGDNSDGGSVGEISYDDSEDAFSLNSNRLINVSGPVDGNDAANKDYVDALVNGLSWKSPVEHPNQFVNGTAGGIRAGGKIYVTDYTQVVAGDTITVTYNGGVSSFTLTASDTPNASSGEFASGSAATSNDDLAASILSALNGFSSASDFGGGYSANIGAAVFVINDDVGSTGVGTIALSGAGLLKINMHEGKTYSQIVAAEARISRSNDAAYTWDDDTNNWVQITGTGGVPYATETTAGVVRLATNGEVQSGEVVQANDSRLHDQNTDSGTDNPFFTMNDLTGNGSLNLVSNEAEGDYTLTISNDKLTADLVIDAEDLQRLAGIVYNSTEINSAIAASHAQNTDTSTSSSAFTFNDGGVGGSITVDANESASSYTLTFTNGGLTTDLVVTGADLEKLVDISYTAAEINAAIAAAHAQNTDTGTDSTTFTVGNGTPSGDVTLAFGSSLTKTLGWVEDALAVGDGAFVFSDDVMINGSLTLGSSTTVSSIINDDTMSTASTSSLATSQSIKNYVSNQVGTINNTKADKVTGGGTAGELAGLDSTGNLTDSGLAISNIDTLSGDQTITGDKTFNGTVTLNSEVTGSAVNTDSNLNGASNTQVASSLAIKNYVDNNTHTQNTDTGTSADGFVLNTDGNNAQLQFGQTANGYLTYTEASDIFNVQGNLDVDGTVNGTDLDSTGLDFNSNATIGTSSNTLAIDSTNWSIAADGTTTGLQIDANTNTITNLDFSDIGTRTKTLSVAMTDLTVQKVSAGVGDSNLCNLYSESDDPNSVTNPHQYYLLKSRQAAPQTLDLRIKVKLPEDFVAFTAGQNHLSLNYKTDGTSDDSKINVIVDDGNAAHKAWDNTTVGTSLSNSTWTTFNVEFDTTGTFNPSAGDYVWVTIKGFSTKAGNTYYSPYIGELYLTYTGR